MSCLKDEQAMSRLAWLLWEMFICHLASGCKITFIWHVQKLFWKYFEPCVNFQKDFKGIQHHPMYKYIQSYIHLGLHNYYPFTHITHSNTMLLPRTRSKTIRPRGFFHSCPAAWDNLPSALRILANLFQSWFSVICCLIRILFRYQYFDSSCGHLRDEHLLRSSVFQMSVYQGCGLGLDVSVSRRSRDLSKVSSRSRLGHVGKRLGLVSVSGAKVSVLVSVSTV